MNKILITGGLGFIGGRLSRRLSKNFEVIVSSRKPVEEKVLSMHGDIEHIGHQKLLDKNFFPKGVRSIIHLAALNEQECMDFPSEAVRVNIDETRKILENAVANKVEQFIYFSTAHVYGSPLTGIITEGVLPRPIHPYAITHKAAEDFVVAANQENNIHGIVVRLSNSFGAPILPSMERWSLLANDLARQAAQSEFLKLRSSGMQFRDFICLTDVENVIQKMVGKNHFSLSHSVYNLGSGTSLRVLDLANIIKDVCGQMFGKSMAIQFPENTEFKECPPLCYSIDRLVSEEFEIENDVKTEIENLLIFCFKNFRTN
jgi:UDP-glucose 4-epimerase